jgi:hypothetical protein
LIRLGNWTASLGVRWGHHQLLVKQNAVSPRVSLSRAWRRRVQEREPDSTDRLNVIDFQGLFSGNAIGPSRSCYARLTASF